MTEIKNHAEFDDELLAGEELIWTGKPDPSVHFSGIDAFLIPFALIWCLPVFGSIATMTTGLWSADGVAVAPTLFVLAIMSIFGIVGIYLLVGRFLYKRWRKLRTYYGLTNRRAIVLLKAGTMRRQAAFLDTVPVINFSKRRSGIGTVRFGNSNPFGAFLGNSGLEFFGFAYGAPEVAFYDLKDADHVYNLAQRQRQ